MDKSLKELFLMAPDSQVDESLKTSIKAWKNTPTALEILHTVDLAIHGSLASGFVVSTLQMLLDEQMKKEGITLNDLIPLATWRR